MIIQINATVCAATDHGEDRRHKIAASDGYGECRKGRKEAVTRAVKFSRRGEEMTVLAADDGTRKLRFHHPVSAPGAAGHADSS